jgi:hypothetical protein
LGGKPQVEKKDAESKKFQGPIAGIDFVTSVVFGMRAIHGNAIANNTTNKIN